MIWMPQPFIGFRVFLNNGINESSKVSLRQIGFTGVAKDNLKTVLYFLPLILAKVSYLYQGIKTDISVLLALIFLTIAIGLSEEIYFRGIILQKLITCFSKKQTVILSAVFFAAVHASQAFSGVGMILTVLTIMNALIFGIIAAEIVLLTKSIVVVIIWHTMFDFVNWISFVKGTSEVIVIVIQSVILTLYAAYLWSKISDQ